MSLRRQLRQRIEEDKGPGSVCVSAFDGIREQRQPETSHFLTLDILRKVTHLGGDDLRNAIDYFTALELLELHFALYDEGRLVELDPWAVNAFRTRNEPIYNPETGEEVTD